MDTPTYRPLREADSHFASVRGLRLHWRAWGDATLASPANPPLVMLHGWMDVGASFQFVVDALAAGGAPPRWVLAPDWRGFGLSDPSGADTYWPADYMADLDLLLDLWSSDSPVDLLGHSLGGNVAMLYAGARPRRVRRLVNLEGFGLPATQPDQALARWVRWLDEVKAPAHLRPYDSLAEVAQRLVANNPRLPADKAHWLARHWSTPVTGDDGKTTWRVLADPAHKRIHPSLYPRDEVVAMWRHIGAPVLWVEGTDTEMLSRWQGKYPREDFEARLASIPHLERACLPDAGHMLHHDQPALLASLLARFLSAAD